MQKKSWALCKVRCTETTPLIRFLWKTLQFQSWKSNSLAVPEPGVQDAAAVGPCSPQSLPGLTAEMSGPQQLLEQWLLSCPSL